MHKRRADDHMIVVSFRDPAVPGTTKSTGGTCDLVLAKHTVAYCCVNVGAVYFADGQSTP